MKRSWCNLIRNVYRRSLSSDPEDESTRPSSGSRSARTPPSTFLFLHLHLSNSPGSKTPLPSREPSTGKPLEEAFQTSHSTTNDNRLGSAVDSLILVRSFTGTKTRLGRGPKQRRAQWAVYKPARSALSTPDVNKSSHREKNLAPQGSLDFSRPNAVLEPQSCDVLVYMGIESPDASGGCGRFGIPWKRRHSGMSLHR
jgi:hypothetical protein